MAHGVNPRSRLIRFSKNSSFHYFTVDEMGLRLMKLALDEMALYRFQRYLQQNGICKASMLPLYLFSLELLSEAYALKKGKQMRAELDRGALFSCQADVVKRICNTGPNLITSQTNGCWTWIRKEMIAQTNSYFPQMLRF